jgi:hypothetical protein
MSADYSAPSLLKRAENPQITPRRTGYIPALASTECQIKTGGTESMAESTGGRRHTRQGEGAPQHHRTKSTVPPLRSILAVRLPAPIHADECA